MKRYCLLFFTMCMALTMHAQIAFEGVMTLKTMNSYSSKFIKSMPYLYSGADTCVVMIKGDNIHMHYKLLGLHKIIKDGRLYYYSENTKKGFQMPVFPYGKFKGKELININQSRNFGDISAHLIKHLSVYNAFTIDEESWIAESNSYAISPKALQNLYTFMFSQISLDFEDALCLKSSSRMLMSARTEGLIETVESIAGKSSVAGTDTEQAKNAATNECAVSYSFEMLSINSETLGNDAFAVPADVDFFVQENLPTVEDDVLAQAEIYPFMKKLFSGKYGEQTFQGTVATTTQSYDYTIEQIDAGHGIVTPKDPRDLEDVRKRGQTVQETACDHFYTAREQLLLTENRQVLKKKKKLKEISNQKEAVIYDINEEWDF